MASILPSAATGSPLEWSSSDWQTLLADSRVQIVGAAVVAPALTIFLWFLVSYYTSPLKKYPGPFLAGEFASFYSRQFD